MSYENYATLRSFRGEDFHQGSNFIKLVLQLSDLYWTIYKSFLFKIILILAFLI